MALAIGYVRVNTVYSITSLLSYGLMTGGPAVMAWGWLLSFSMTMIVALCLAEIAGAYPSTGQVA